MEIFLVLIFVGVMWFLTKLIFRGNFKAKQPTLFNKEERIEREKREKERYEEYKNYKGSESYQALLKKYDGNIPGSGQGDRGGEKVGKKGGRYIKRVSKKTGKPYRHYF